MAKSKEATSVQKKGKKEKKQEKSAAKKSARASTAKPKPDLSEERVVDSSSEDETPGKQSPAVDSAKKSKKKKPRTKAPPPPPPPEPVKPPTPDSSEDDSDESENSDEDEEMTDVKVLRKPETIAPKVNGVKRKAEEEVSSLEDEESSEDSDSEDAAEPVAKRAKTEDLERKGKEDSSEAESSSESEDEEAGAADKAVEAAPAKSVQPSIAALGARESIPAKPFVPPRGHSVLDITGSVFSEGTLSGKQIWHITAPRGVPFQSIKEVALDAVRSGATVLHHKGMDYILTEQIKHADDVDGPALPSNQGINTASQATLKTLNLQQKIKLPTLGKKQTDIATGSSAAADIAQPAVSDVRPQPKGLHMRYKPAGFGAGDPGLGSDSEEDGGRANGTTSKFQFPKTLGGHGSGRPQEGDTNAESKPTKSKKKPRDSDVVMGTSGVAARSPPVAAPSDEMSKEERRKRKAEKKARKEGRTVAAAA